MFDLGTLDGVSAYGLGLLLVAAIWLVLLVQAPSSVSSEAAIRSDVRRRARRD